MAEREYSNLIKKILGYSSVGCDQCGCIQVLADHAQDLTDERRKRLFNMAEIECKLELVGEMYPNEMKIVDRAVECMKKVAMNFTVV